MRRFEEGKLSIQNCKWSVTCASLLRVVPSWLSLLGLSGLIGQRVMGILFARSLEWPGGGWGLVLLKRGFLHRNTAGARRGNKTSSLPVTIVTLHGKLV